MIEDELREDALRLNEDSRLRNMSHMRYRSTLANRDSHRIIIVTVHEERNKHGPTKQPRYPKPGTYNGTITASLQVTLNRSDLLTMKILDCRELTSAGG